MGVCSPLTGAESRWLFSHEVLGAHIADFYLDEQAGYVFAHDPFWLAEAYSSAITTTDTGCLARNIQNVQSISACLQRNHKLADEGVDLGGGYGLFVRGMRDAGYRFYWSDRYSENLLARGFEATDTIHPIATAFEVLEHTEDPIDFIRKSKNTSGFDTLFFSATCLDENKIPEPDWWYWSFETGQHISFFSLRSLKYIASELGMILWHASGDIFAFSESSWTLEQASKKPTSLAIRLWLRLQRNSNAVLKDTPETGPDSLTYDDHLEMAQRLGGPRQDPGGTPHGEPAEQASRVDPARQG